ncbi:MAG TPA: hypothetical protein DCQ06_02885, partial [Myxococcales bacterium]|nr:hypothetical protein [Myxococcales bacterium]
MVLGLARAFQRSDSKTLCRYFDQERVYFDLRSRDPAFSFTKDLSGAKACASLDSGRLSRYLQEFGPAEVHSNPAILIPSLFRVHGGAYLELSADERVEHRKRLQTLRAGKQAIACDMYWVVAADNLFTVHLECDGVRSYELFLRRDGKDDFK